MAHEARQQAVDRAHDLRVGAGHAGRDPTLQRLEARQNRLPFLKLQWNGVQIYITFIYLFIYLTTHSTQRSFSDNHSLITKL